MAHPDMQEASVTQNSLEANDSRDPGEQMRRLAAIMARLRSPGTGCPWDLEQSFDTIAPYTIEEAHEVADAIERRAWDELAPELGDLAFQVVFHARMAEEDGLFDLADVLKAVCDKMIARHPHVFGTESNAKSAEQQTADWEKIKAKERAGRKETGVLDGVAMGLPALTRALKLQNRAARVGFDWLSSKEVLAKLVEEAKEVEEARDSLGPDELNEEYGDLLFVMVNLGRHMGLDPEACLRAANRKFTRRFGYIEENLSKRGKTPAESSLEEMDALWNEARAMKMK